MYNTLEVPYLRLGIGYCGCFKYYLFVGGSEPNEYGGLWLKIPSGVRVYPISPKYQVYQKYQVYPKYSVIPDDIQKWIGLGWVSKKNLGTERVSGICWALPPKTPQSWRTGRFGDKKCLKATQDSQWKLTHIGGSKIVGNCSQIEDESWSLNSFGSLKSVLSFEITI